MSASTLTRPGEAATPVAASLPHLVGLDGLRAVAVAAVVLYHADVMWLPGGFLGVDVFFVLSGFLITSLLLVELDRSGRIDFGRFYLRRARRLLPALVAVLIAVAFLVATVAYDSASGFRRDLPGALLYVSNWTSILTDLSYFEFIGRPPMLQHLWSLAVEEQFYIVWPSVALLAYRWRAGRGVAIVALTLALGSTVAMLVGSVLGDMPASADPSRLYFGTDTHSMGILLGAALAVFWRPGRTAAVLDPRASAVISGAGVAGLAALIAMFVLFGEYSTTLYRGGFLLVALVSAVVVAAASHRGAAFGPLLGNKPMRWIGRRSYGIYLWHWPLFLVTRPGVDIPITGIPALALRLGLLLVIADLSYRFVEMPVRRGALGRFWTRVVEGGVPRPNLRQAAMLGVAGVAVLVCAVRIVIAPAPSAASDSTLDQLPAVDSVEQTQPPQTDGAVDAALTDPRPKVSAFGDSVLLGASGALGKSFRLDLHAKVGEQAGQLNDVVKQQVAQAKVRDLVVVHVGNNGIVPEARLRATLDELASADRVALVTVRVPRAWMAPNNRLFVEVAKDYPNVVIADWAAKSEGQGDYFVSDRVHLSAKGVAVYSEVIAEALGVSAEG